MTARDRATPLASRILDMETIDRATFGVLVATIGLVCAVAGFVLGALVVSR